MCRVFVLFCLFNFSKRSLGRSKMEAMEAPSIDAVRESTTSKEILVRTSRRSGGGGTFPVLHHRGGAMEKSQDVHTRKEKFDTNTHTKDRENRRRQIMVRLYAFTKKGMTCDTITTNHTCIHFIEVDAMLTKTFRNFLPLHQTPKPISNASGTKSSTCNISNAGALRQMSLFHVSFCSFDSIFFAFKVFQNSPCASTTQLVDLLATVIQCAFVADAVNIFKRREWV